MTSKSLRILACRRHTNYGIVAVRFEYINATSYKQLKAATLTPNPQTPVFPTSYHFSVAQRLQMSFSFGLLHL
jgi:hypothetical protein